MSERTKERRTSWQIAKYQTGKKLLETLDKLDIASPEFYAHIHANGERTERGRKHSLIGLNLLDYSNGTGENTVTVKFNLEPEFICYWFEKVKIGKKDFSETQEKIIAAAKDKDGRSPVQKIMINRREKDTQGRPTRYPWYVKIENGTGIAQDTDTGSCVIKSGSWKVENTAFINFSDYDLYKLLRKTVRFIEVWEDWAGYNLLEESDKINFLKNRLNSLQNSSQETLQNLLRKVMVYTKSLFEEKS